MSFWREKDLTEFTEAEWESLCDGCARCCLVKLEDEDTGEVHYTSLACDLLDLDACRCTRYPQRHELVPDCIEFHADLAATLSWLPDTCAYRLLAEGLELPEWHPLVTGRAESVHEAGISVRGRVRHAADVPEAAHANHVIRWVEM
ncbi:MAG: YcgN family cysteine cluster protein [Pseudomonadota bacterium]